MAAIDVAEIVSEYLKANGFDGLAGEECGCGLDGLMPCGECYTECEAAYHWPAKDCPSAADESCEWYSECAPHGCWRTKRPPHTPTD